MKLILNPEYNLYGTSGGQIFCDSLQIAETFGKRHDHVLRDIENALNAFNEINAPKFGETNFIKTTYRDSQNKKQPMYLLTRDGFSYIAMGFTGKEAAKFKIGYITRFNLMEELIRTQIIQKTEIHPALMESITAAHEFPQHHHYSNEQNMIYKIVLGMDAKTYRQRHGLQEHEVIKPYLSLDEIKAVEDLQRVDIGLFEAGFDYEQRKQTLNRRYHRAGQALTA